MIFNFSKKMTNKKNRFKESNYQNFKEFSKQEIKQRRQEREETREETRLNRMIKKREKKEKEWVHVEKIVEIPQKKSWFF